MVPVKVSGSHDFESLSRTKLEDIMDVVFGKALEEPVKNRATMAAFPPANPPNTPPPNVNRALILNVAVPSPEFGVKEMLVAWMV
jgi:hypothetical protein